ncbi:hypothetical protein [Gordonia sp. VNK21]|uniref:hypothetical protein n=1 Tax=Gordonia sp. VNK21 TaxID=3382483 RepID=UPI0038D3D596
MARTKWNDLTDQQKAAIIAAAAVDGGLRLWAGRDLAARNRHEVNGPKWLWAAGLSTINSLGVLPALYLLLGRRRRAADAAAS